MKKRPLCAICVLFLMLQWMRVLFFGTEDTRPSALEKAVLTEPQVRLAGTVYKIEEKDKVTAFFLKENVISVNGQTVEESGILVYVSNTKTENSKEKSVLSLSRAARQIRLGNRLEISGEAQRFEPARNPGSFDQRAYYQRQGIHALVWADKVRILSDDTDEIRQYLSEVRKSWADLIVRHLGEYYGGTMNAILLGEKSGLDDETKKMYQKNGISHLLAISGLHMSFIGMGVYSLFRRSGCGFLSAGLTGSVILLSYCLMTGSGISSLRALIMFLVRIGAEVTGRDYDLPTSLSLSAAILCAWQPLCLTDAGFLLSYGAILGLFLLTPVFEEMSGCAGSRKHTGRIFGALSSSLAVNVFLLGPLLYFYYEVPPYSVLLNLIVIPVMPTAMGAGIAGSILCIVSDTLGGLVLQVCRAVLCGYDLVCTAGSMIPGSRFVTGKPGAAWLLLYYAGIGAAWFLFRFLSRRKEESECGESVRADQSYGLLKRLITSVRMPGCVLLVFAAGMAAACRQQYRGQEGVQVTVLDVGQGDCIYIRTPSLHCLIDGGSSDVSSVGTYRIEPFLLSCAVDRLDYVFVTHGDEDHVNGIQELLEGQALGVRIDELVLPPAQYHDDRITETARMAAGNGVGIVTMETGDAIIDRGVGKHAAKISCLAPAGDEGLEQGNTASLVLEVSCGRRGMLFTGDVEGAGEKNLMTSGLLQKYDVLKAAHHGSKNSGSEEFLKAVSPDYAVISAGVDNRYGHPHEETVRRLSGAGCTVYSTQDNGALTIWTDGDALEMTGFMDK